MDEIVLQHQFKQPLPPPRVVRNKGELDKLLAAKNIKSEWPPVWEQLPTAIIGGLFKDGYNPSIIRFNGKLLMTYRFHQETGFYTKIAIAELDEKFNVTYNQELDLNDENSCEDGRLFERNGHLYMFYISSTFPTFPACQVKCVMLAKPDKWRASEKFEYWLPDRQTFEKNHVPLEWDGELNVIYRHNQIEDGDTSKITQVIYCPSDKREMKTPALRWPWGEIRGGTTPILWKGKLLKFFHSMLENEMPPVNLRYTIGAMLMKAEKPFQMLQVSKRPILRGSEIGGNETRQFFKRNVVFPGGSIEHEGGWLISIGVNDTLCCLVKVMPENLNL